MSIDQKFSGNGVAQELGATLNKTITWNDLITSQPTLQKKTDVEASIRSHDQTMGNVFSYDASPGQTLGKVATSIGVNVPILSYGVSDSWTVALAVPLYKVDIDVKTGFQSSELGQSWAEYVSRKSVFKGSEASAKLVDPINEKLSRLGYKPIQNESFQAVGDIKVVGKYQFLKTDRDTLALKPSVTLPTGKKLDVDKALDIPTGDGQWDTGITLAYDRDLKHRWTWNSYVGFNLQLPDTMERRIPTKSDDLLSEDKEMVYRDSGDQVLVGTGVLYGTPTRGFTAGLNFNYQYMNPTSIHGTQFAKERYTWLENQYPLQDLVSGLMTVGYSTIDAFKEKAFLLPLQTNLTYSRVLAGRNVTTNDVVSAELVLFF